MSSIIVQTAARALVPAIFVCAAALFIRGHHLPGGGFSAGLLAVAAGALLLLVFGAERVRATVRTSARALLGVGLALAVVSGFVGAAKGEAFLAGVWGELPLGAEVVKVGTPLLFDLGVLFVVVGFGTNLLLMTEEG
jgi:multisubunit Na+/H+ antiporter MnhB subunit